MVIKIHWFLIISRFLNFQRACCKKAKLASNLSLSLIFAFLKSNTHLPWEFYLYTHPQFNSDINYYLIFQIKINLSCLCHHILHQVQLINVVKVSVIKKPSVSVIKRSHLIVSIIFFLLYSLFLRFILSHRHDLTHYGLDSSLDQCGDNQIMHGSTSHYSLCHLLLLVLILMSLS